MCEFLYPIITIWEYVCSYDFSTCDKNSYRQYVNLIHLNELTILDIKPILWVNPVISLLLDNSYIKIVKAESCDSAFSY